MPQHSLFQSTRPLRGATAEPTGTPIFNTLFQSTRPLRGATSTALPLEPPPIDFNPRAPCGARLTALTARKSLQTFQSTRPLRGATRHFRGRRKGRKHFNPRAPCGARPRPFRRCLLLPYFNPRAPCGARPRCCGNIWTRGLFQSTRPLRGATGQYIHRASLFGFQSTRPLRGATRRKTDEHKRICISIHAPLAGRDKLYESVRGVAQNFNPRAPCGARQQTCTKNMYMFVRTDKRNSFPCRTLSVRAPDEKL